MANPLGRELTPEDHELIGRWIDYALAWARRQARGRPRLEAEFRSAAAWALVRAAQIRNIKTWRFRTLLNGQLRRARLDVLRAYRPSGVTVRGMAAGTGKSAAIPPEWCRDHRELGPLDAVIFAESLARHLSGIEVLYDPVGSSAANWECRYRAILAALARNEGNKKATAREMGVSLRTVQKAIKRLAS